MTKKTRYFMLGSFAILVAGLCTGLVAYYGGLPTFATQGGPPELAYVPANAAVVAFADVREVMDSEMRRRLTKVMPEADRGKGREEFQKMTGIDVERDIDHIVAFMTPKADDADKSDHGFVAFRGRFDAVKLEAMAREHGAVVEQYKGKRLVKIDPSKMDHGHGEAMTEALPHRGGNVPTMVLAFAEPGLVMFGDEKTVRTAIDTAAGAASSVTGNAEMMALVKDVDRDSNAWAVGRFDLLASRAKLPSEISSQIPAIRWFAASGRINGGMAGTLRAEARDEQAAQNLRDVMNGLMALARLQGGSRPEVQSMLQSLRLSGTGKTVEIGFEIPAQLFDLMLPKAQPKIDEK
jgi:hypothetical protein